MDTKKTTYQVIKSQKYPNFSYTLTFYHIFEGVQGPHKLLLGGLLYI